MENINKMDPVVLTAKIFRALGSPIRIQMLLLLSKQDYCACKFPDLLSISQPNSSRNLDVLKKAGLVISYRDGQKIIYQLKNKEIISLIDQLRNIFTKTE